MDIFFLVPMKKPALGGLWHDVGRKNAIGWVQCWGVAVVRSAANHAVDHLAQLRSERTAETAIRPSIDNAQDLNIKDEPRSACIRAPFLNSCPS